MILGRVEAEEHLEDRHDEGEGEEGEEGGQQIEYNAEPDVRFVFCRVFTQEKEKIFQG